MYHNIDSSPAGVIKAIEKYCNGVGSLYDIASALETNATAFQSTMDWYLTHLMEPCTSQKPEVQTVALLIIFQTLKTLRVELAKSKKQHHDLASKIRRVTTPYREKVF